MTSLDLISMPIRFSQFFGTCEGWNYILVDPSYLMYCTNANWCLKITCLAFITLSIRYAHFSQIWNMSHYRIQFRKDHLKSVHIFSFEKNFILLYCQNIGTRNGSHWRMQFWDDYHQISFFFYCWKTYGNLKSEWFDFYKFQVRYA